MVASRVDTFGGMIPAADKRLLPDAAASHSENTWLYSGALVGIVAPKFVRNCSPDTSKVYRIPNSYTNTEAIEDALWLEFPQLDTDVVRSPIVDDAQDRYYWASEGASPMVNSRARIAAGSPAYKLGVPSPGSGLSVSPSGGASSTTATRAYVVTWVTAWGEEGPPGVPAVATGKIDDTWNVTFPVAGSSEITDHNLSKARLYRTVTSTGGAATYFFVAEFDISTTTYADTNADAAVSSNEQIASTTWTAPPDDLVGMTTMPNGMIAGWRNNELWFCEPYRPHAWPAQYTLAVEYPIIGLGVINQTLVVCTGGYPMVATGINPASMTLSKLTSFEPCASRGSIVSAPEGVYYASPNGLVLVTNGVATVITEKLITKDEWQRLLKVRTLRATRLQGAYYAYGSARFAVFQSDFAQESMVQQLDYAGAYTGALIDPKDQRVAFNVLSNEVPATNVFSDPWTGETFIIREGKLYRLDITDQVAPREVLRWRSKVFQPNNKKNFQAMRVYFEIPPWAPTLNTDRNTNLEQELAADQYGLVRVYADDTLVMTRELRTSGELMRIPAGYKADFWSVEFEAVVKILSFQMGTSVKALANA